MKPESAKSPAQQAVDAKPPDNGPHSPRAMKRLAEEKAQVIAAGSPKSEFIENAYKVSVRKPDATKVGDIAKTYTPEEVRSKARAFAASEKLTPEERRVLKEILGDV